MSKVTVSQLAEVLGVDVSKLLEQFSDAGIEGSSGDDAVSNDDKKKLLAYLRASHGKMETDATAPRKVTLKRKTVSELRVAGSGPRASTRTVNVEVRKRRTYVKREVVQEQLGTDDADREEARRILEESRIQREAEEKARQEVAEKARKMRSASEKKIAPAKWPRSSAGVIRKNPGQKPGRLPPAMVVKSCMSLVARLRGAVSPALEYGALPRKPQQSMGSHVPPHRSPVKSRFPKPLPWLTWPN
jgi:translation initiation factor IF-2